MISIDVAPNLLDPQSLSAQLGGISSVLFQILQENGQVTLAQGSELSVGEFDAEIAYENLTQNGLPTIPRVQFSPELFIESSLPHYPLIYKNKNLHGGLHKYYLSTGLELLKVLVANTYFMNDFTSAVTYYNNVVLKHSQDLWQIYRQKQISQYIMNSVYLDHFVGNLNDLTSFRVLVTQTGRIAYALQLTSEIRGYRQPFTNSENTTAFYDRATTWGQNFRIDDMLFDPHSPLFIKSPEFRSNSGRTFVTPWTVTDEVHELISSCKPFLKGALFIGIDLMKDFEGKWRLIELNDWPQIEPNHFNHTIDHRYSSANINAYIEAFRIGYLES